MICFLFQMTRGGSSSSSTRATFVTLSRALCSNGILALFGLSKMPDLSEPDPSLYNEQRKQEMIERFKIPRDSCMLRTLDLAIFYWLFFTWWLFVCLKVICSFEVYELVECYLGIPNLLVYYFLIYHLTFISLSSVFCSSNTVLVQQDSSSCVVLLLVNVVNLTCFLCSSLLYEHVPGHGQHHRRSHRLGLPQTNADGTNPLHTRHTCHCEHHAEGFALAYTYLII